LDKSTDNPALAFSEFPQEDGRTLLANQSLRGHGIFKLEAKNIEITTTAGKIHSYILKDPDGQLIFCAPIKREIHTRVGPTGAIIAVDVTIRVKEAVKRPISLIPIFTSLGEVHETSAYRATLEDGTEEIFYKLFLTDDNIGSFAHFFG
jgi:hypothetical protein